MPQEWDLYTRNAQGRFVGVTGDEVGQGLLWSTNGKWVNIVPGYGGMVLSSPTPGASLGVGWDVITEFDTIDLGPKYISYDLLTGVWTYEAAGIWRNDFGMTLSHNESNQGRELFLRLYDVTNGLALPSVPFGVARNQPTTNISVNFPLQATAGQQYRIEISGGTDSFTSIVYETISLDSYIHVYLGGVSVSEATGGGEILDQEGAEILDQEGNPLEEQ